MRRALVLSCVIAVPFAVPFAGWAASPSEPSDLPVCTPQTDGVKDSDRARLVDQWTDEDGVERMICACHTGPGIWDFDFPDCTGWSSCGSCCADYEGATSGSCSWPN